MLAKLAEMRRQVERDNKFKAAVGHVLRRVRKERRLSQEALAENSGVSLNQISLVERGQVNATLLLLFDLAAALQVSGTELVRQVEIEITKTEATPPDHIA